MEQNSQSHNLQAFDMLRRAAKEYNNSEFKFYAQGFFKFKREGDKTLLIEDIYVTPEFRGTPVASMIFSDFEDYIKTQGILMYYGYVHKGKGQQQRLNTFTDWGMKSQDVESLAYVIVSKQVEY